MTQSATSESRSDGDLAAFQRRKWPYYWLARVNARYLAALEPGLREIGMDMPRWRVLSCLDHDRPMGITELAELAVVKVPTMMKIVQRMACDGLVRLAPRENDGRVTEVHLTPVGQVARERVIGVANAVHDRAFADIGDDSRRQLIASLRHALSLMS